MPQFYQLTNGNIIEVYFEEFYCGDSPREWEPVSTFLTWMRNYNSPDENIFECFEDFLAEFGVDYTGDKKTDLTNLIDSADKLGYFMFPVYVMEHSTITYSLSDFNDPWDSGLAGVMFAKKDRIFNETNITPTTENLVESVAECFKGELDDYNNWINGYIMGYSVYDLKERDIVDGCTGYLGIDAEESGISDELGLKDAQELGEFNNLNECIGSLYMNNKL